MRSALRRSCASARAVSMMTGIWRVASSDFSVSSSWKPSMMGIIREVYDERYQEKYGYWRPIVEQSVAAFLKCGNPQEGFARVRCPDCKHEMFVAFSCKQRCTCPSCPPEADVADLGACCRRCLLAGRSPASCVEHPQTSANSHPLRSPGETFVLLRGRV